MAERILEYWDPRRITKAVLIGTAETSGADGDKAIQRTKTMGMHVGRGRVIFQTATSR